MGRPGLDPGTLGAGQTRPSASLQIHLTWSEGMPRPPATADVLSNLPVWLHDWLQTLGSGGLGVISYTGPDGATFELRIEGSKDHRTT